jgi:hypothetical protein
LQVSCGVRVNEGGRAHARAAITTARRRLLAVDSRFRSSLEPGNLSCPWASLDIIRSAAVFTRSLTYRKLAGYCIAKTLPATDFNIDIR